jgi:electron transfer flavoprotein beta subunit
LKHVLVVTKSTPDTAAAVEVAANGAVTWGNAPLVINPWDEYAVTEAVLLKEAHGVKTTILAIGSDIHVESLKQGLAIGIDAAARVWDEALDGQDSWGYAQTVAAAIRKLGDVDLIIFGKEFADLVSDAHVFQTARALGWAAFGGVSKIRAVDFAAGTIQLERQLEEGKQTLAARLPCAIAVLKEINEPRYPSFINIRKAAKAIIPVWTCVDLGLDPKLVGGAGATVKTTGYRNLAARSGKVEIIEGANESEKAKKLIAKLMEAKVL